MNNISKIGAPPPPVGGPPQTGEAGASSLSTIGAAQPNALPREKRAEPRTGSAAAPIAPTFSRNPERDPFTNPNPRHPMFRNHSCWKCNDGEKPCAQTRPGICEYPHARND